MATAERIVWGGRTWSRYPSAASSEVRDYFRRTVVRSGKRKTWWLHQEVYRKFHGPIPSGMVVHHKDHDSLNNDPTNLMLVTPPEHARMHPEGLEAARRAAALWHGSPAGLAWHREHARQQDFGRFDYGKRPCDVCGKKFRQRTKRARFCGNNCRATFRRRSGVDDETRKCERCGAEYRANRYGAQRYCSRPCGVRRPDG